jgi:hypothetical protein
MTTVIYPKFPVGRNNVDLPSVFANAAEAGFI